MKKIVSVTEVSGEGLEALLGEQVLLICSNYFYAGELSGVNDDCVLLSKPYIVYETGPWTDKQYKDAQALPVGQLYVSRSFIESFGKQSESGAKV